MSVFILKTPKSCPALLAVFLINKIPDAFRWSSCFKYGLRILREYRQDPDASSFVFRDVRGQLAELATTVGSPGAAVKCEKDGPFGEPGLERHGIALVIG